jgi:opacity protein-like surface antigen
MLKALTALALILTPVTAHAATSPYVEASTAYNGHSATYGGKVGLQVNNVALEAGAEGPNLTYVAAIGLQPKIFGPFSAYAQAGYLNRHGDSGFRLGGGLLTNLTEHIYAKGGYQRDDYGHGHSDAATLGLGVKF